MKMRETKVKSEANEKGITLVALVVTIIVLMILAGITLSLVLGQNGIIGKAQQAKELSTNADKATGEGMNNLENEMESATRVKSQVEIYRDNKTIISVTDNTPIKDDEGNTVTIPAGFKIANDSATKQEDGIVIEDKDGNQFVWIPVANISNYARIDFGKYWPDHNYTNFSETMPVDEQTSVSEYKGYYIGRYETGDSISTVNKTLREMGASVTNAMVIKKGEAPYNYITKDQAITIATGMKITENYNATTKICSSYAWDTAINFLKSKVSDYPITSPQGNYSDTTFNYIDITGTTQTKSAGSNILVPTGQTTPICNIFDIGGNVWEWTTEICNDNTYPYTVRGGNLRFNYSDYPAGARSITTNTYSINYVGFRVTLYM